MVTRFWWLRHGPVEGLPPGTIIGQADEPCSLPPAAMAWLRARLPDPAVVLSSPLCRAVETARVVAGREPDALEPALIEQDFGTWTLRTWEAVATEADAVQFWQAPATTRPPGGEAFADQVARVSALIERLARDHRGGDVVMVCHAGTIRAALVQALGLAATPQAALAFVLDPLSLTRVDVFPDGAGVGGVNLGLGAGGWGAGMSV